MRFKINSLAAVRCVLNEGYLFEPKSVEIYIQAFVTNSKVQLKPQAHKIVTPPPPRDLGIDVRLTYGEGAPWLLHDIVSIALISFPVMSMRLGNAYSVA